MEGNRGVISDVFFSSWGTTNNTGQSSWKHGFNWAVIPITLGVIAAVTVVGVSLLTAQNLQMCMGVLLTAVSLLELYQNICDCTDKEQTADIELGSRSSATITSSIDDGALNEAKAELARVQEELTTVKGQFQQTQVSATSSPQPLATSTMTNAIDEEAVRAAEAKLAEIQRQIEIKQKSLDEVGCELIKKTQDLTRFSTLIDKTTKVKIPTSSSGNGTEASHHHKSSTHHRQRSLSTSSTSLPLTSNSKTLASLSVANLPTTTTSSAPASPSSKSASSIDSRESSSGTPTDVPRTTPDVTLPPNNEVIKTNN